MEICGVLARAAPAISSPSGVTGGSARQELAVKTGSRSFPGEGGGSLDLAQWETPMLRGGGSDNPEAGNREG